MARAHGIGGGIGGQGAAVGEQVARLAAFAEAGQGVERGRSEPGVRVPAQRPRHPA
jgi:hypothetical protein